MPVSFFYSLLLPVMFLLWLKLSKCDLVEMKF